MSDKLERLLRVLLSSSWICMDVGGREGVFFPGDEWVCVRCDNELSVRLKHERGSAPLARGLRVEIESIGHLADPARWVPAASRPDVLAWLESERAAAEEAAARRVRDAARAVLQDDEVREAILGLVATAIDDSRGG